MTVSSEQSSVTYVGNGVTVLFAIPYYFLEKTHITVSLVSSTGAIIPKILDVDYTVAGAGNQAGGSLTFTVAPPNLSTLIILREVPVTQLTDYQPNDDFPAESHERALDKLTMIAQQAIEDISRALVHPVNNEHYQAEARRIINLEDPVDLQDAATKKWAQDFVSAIIQTGQGPFNNAANVIFAPTGIGASPTTVQAALDQFNQKQTGNFWSDSGGKANRVADRLFIGDGVEYDGNKFPTTRSWVGFEANGFMTYFDSRSQMTCFSTIGAVGGAFASRTSDNVQLGESACIGVGSYVNNDNPNAADKKSAWGFYAHAVHTQLNEFTACMEVDIANRQATVKVTPYQMGAVGTTAAHWIGTGGETGQSGLSVTPASVAIGIVATSSRNAIAGTGALFDKGIVFQADAISGCDGVNGQAIAIEMAKGQAINWLTGTNGPGARIRSDNTASTNETRLIFATSGLRFVGLKPDLITEQNLMTVPASPTAVNYAQVDAGATGTPVTYGVNGTDTDIDVRLGVKGAGVVRTSYNVTNATTPANFTAQQMLKIKDGTGTIYYIPCRATTW